MKIRSRTIEVKSKEIIKALIGFGLLYIGFYLMGSVNLHIGLFQELTLLVFSLLAALLSLKTPHWNGLESQKVSILK